MKNLILIGYRGTGKTTLGEKIAEVLNKKLIDTDKIIEDIAGKSIPKIFEEDGEEKFREIETQALKQAIQNKDSIISCGGGIIVKRRNLDYLKQEIVCLLTADEKTIYDRIYEDSNRPALTDKNPMEEIKHLLEIRGSLYQEASDFEVNTAAKKEDESIRTIIETFNQMNS